MRRKAEQPGSDPSDIATPDREADDIRREAAAVVGQMLPWGVSVVLHAALVLLAIFIAWQTLVAQTQPDELVIPTTTFDRQSVIPFRQVTSQRLVSGSSAAHRSISQSERSLASSIARTSSPLTLIGVASSQSGKSHPFDSTGNDVIGVGTVFEVPGHATRIVYVVDASGSLIDTMPFVLAELKRSILELENEQRFAVVFFQNGRVVEAPPLGLKPATGENREAVNRWLDASSGNIAPMWLTSPMAAIRKALSYKPQLVLLLSDNVTGRGRYEIQQSVLIKAIEGANTAGARINTIQFLYPDPLENPAAGRQGTLRMIADRSGGVYRFVAAAELGIR